MNPAVRKLRRLWLDWVAARPDPDWARVVDVLAPDVDGWEARALLHRPLPDALADRVAAAAPTQRPGGILAAMEHSVWNDALRAYAGRPSQLDRTPTPGCALPVPQVADVLRFRADPRWPTAVGGAPDKVKAALVTAGRRSADVASLLVTDPRLDLGNQVQVFTDRAGDVLRLAGALDPTVGAIANLTAARSCGLAVLGQTRAELVLEWLVDNVLVGTGDRWLAEALAESVVEQHRLGPWIVTEQTLDGQPTTLRDAVQHATAGWALVADLDAALPTAGQWRAALRLAGRFEGTADEFVTTVRIVLA